MNANNNSTARKFKKLGSDMKKVDAYVLGPKDYEEIPELTEEWFARATVHIGGVPVSRGRPKSQSPKEHVNLRLDPDVLAHFRAGGPGWQSRINATLRQAAKLDVPTKRKSAPARRG
jgi:uncharacterized protein (DUF4415 family)